MLHTAWIATLAGVIGAMLVLSGSGSAASQVAPSNTSPPTISGTAQEGSTLTASTGRWSGTTPIDYSYQWRRCDADGGSCSAISGAIQSTYTLKAVDADNTLRVHVTARNSDGSAGATSVPTAVVKLAPKTPAGNCSGSGSSLNVLNIAPPERLAIDRQAITPAIVGRSAQNVVVRFHVSCGGRPVQGALVYATAVPYNQFTVPAEQSTDTEGWAELTLDRLRGYPAARNQQLLVVFVRARKSGENPLGGISTRRLVSFRVDLSR